MNAEILAVGTELLMGQIANTNAQYISGRLPDVGVYVYYHSVVGDNPGRLCECLDVALKRSDVVIMTGGLGPTKDDLTKETLAKALNLKLVLHEESYNAMKDYFARINRVMTENNVKQAYLPENSIIITNSHGTAPGCIVESGKKIVIMLPGPPAEMKPMFEETVIPYFYKYCDSKLDSKYVKIFGIGESAVENMLMDIVESQSNPTIASYAKDGEITLRITAKYDTGDTSDIITPIIDEIKRRVGDAVFSTDNESIEEVAARLLMKNNLTISIAESCTGGLVSEKLTSIPGISKVFDRAMVTYSNNAKVENLGVNPKTLEKYGAVSRETANEMAQGIRKVSKTDIGLSFTGIAGPDGGTPEKPVGLVYVAIADQSKVDCRELKLRGSRDRIRNLSALHGFDMIRRKMLKMN